MRRLLALLTFLLSVLIANPSLAQNFWEKANAREQFIEMRNGHAGDMYALNDRLFQSLDDGKSWIVFNNQTGEQSLAVDSNQVFYVSTASALFISKDTGGTWVDLKFKGCTALEVHSGTLYAAADSGLYRSSDQGLNWTHLYSTSLPIVKIAFAKSGQIFIVQRGAVRRIEADGTGAKLIYPTSGEISSICTSAPQNVFITVAKDLGGAIELSTDNGETGFTELGFGSTMMNGVVVGDGGKIYAVGGVQDNSSHVIKGYALEAAPLFANTSDISSGLPNTNIRVLSLSPHGRLVVSTDSGIYRSVKSVAAVSTILASNFSTSIYPNPSSGAVTLHMEIVKPGNASVVIYDAMGRVVARPFDGIISSGAHDIQLNALPTTAGQYFCRVTTALGTTTTMLTRIR